MKKALSIYFALLISMPIIAQKQSAGSHEQPLNNVNCYAYNNISSHTITSETELFAKKHEVTINNIGTLNEDTPEHVYRRSSLYTILLGIDPVFQEEEDWELNKYVMDAYSKAPFPDKYNDHRLEISSFKFNDYAGISSDNLQQLGDENDEKKSRRIDDAYIKASERFLKENEIAKGMVAKWFNRQDDGTFDMDLIHERGSYDASAMQVQLASGSVRGMAMLQDAGEELIKNTFVIINRMRFVKNEPIARAVRDIAYSVAEKRIKEEFLQSLAKAAADGVYESTKDGYSVWTISFLFQLEWDDEIANNFYENMWMDKSNSSEERKYLFDNADIFNLKFVGYEKSKSLVLFSAGKSKEEIIEVATIRNIDKTYAQLQKSYDVFKTKTPIVSTNPITAKIGLKEGLSGGDRFDVLEMTYDIKTGRTKYVKVGQVRVDGKNIWDNRYALSEADIGIDVEEKSNDAEEIINDAVENADDIDENVNDVEKNASDVEKKTKDTEGTLNATIFKGSKNIKAGMLLRQVK
ncbi:MAG: hypothetical protein ACOX0M_00210 [Salinivirgaceae bacterium]|jgi:hypothetical protein